MPSRNDDTLHHHVEQPFSLTGGLSGYPRRYTHTEVAALGAVLTGTIDPAGFPADVRVVGCIVRRPEVMAGTTTLVMDVGDVANPNELVDALDLQVLDEAGAHQPGDGVYVPFTFEAAYAPRVTFTSTVENLDATTAGEVEIMWVYLGASPSHMAGAGDDTALSSP